MEKETDDNVKAVDSENWAVTRMNGIFFVQVIELVAVAIGKMNLPV